MSEPIIGGHLDTTTKGVVALAFKAHSQVAVFCSGSLLAPNLVLTARHCIAQIDDGSSEEVHCDTSTFTAKYDPRQIFVSTDSEPQSSGGQLFPVKEIREAPGGDKVCGYDVALLILSGGGVPSGTATPIEPVLEDPTLANITFSAVGYGLQDPNDTAGKTAGTRQRFDTSSVYCVGNSCPSAAGSEADEFVGNSPVCSGDSGGPALDSEGRVFGVTSRGDDACTYALYSNVASWATFVRSTALDAAAAAGYTPAAWATGDVAIHPGLGGASSSGNAGSSAGSAAAGGKGNASAGNASGGTAASNGGAGNSAAGATVDLPPPGQPITPTVDPLGDTCSVKSDCPGTYKCYSTTGQPPGSCVPTCSAANPTCPKDYTCSVGAEVCTPSAAVTKKISTSCALSGRPQSGGNAAFAVLLGVGLTWLGRRRRLG
ncbi:MAG: trypsin-like serine protease [Myxococcales bacterium]